MSPSLIAAIVLGMWLSATNPPSPAPTAGAVLGWLLGEAFFLAAVLRLASHLVISRSRTVPTGQARARRLLHRVSGASTPAVLLAFAWLLLGAGWLDFVRQRTASTGSSLVEQAAILAPYCLLRVICWWGLLPGERAAEGPGVGRLASDFPALLGRARQQWGLLLPVLAFLLLAQDFVGFLKPDWSTNVTAQVVLMAVLGLTVAACAPHLLRLAWPTRPLPPGPLRDRLEAIAGRHGFRFREILLWDTENRLVNAVVTGILPWSRYVLLSDALVACLDPAEIEAIFGHEVGHVAHRHLSYLVFFAVATLALATTGGEWIASSWTWALPDGMLGEAIHGLVVVTLAGGVFLLVFGFLSRRFERQADLFGCRVASELIGDPERLDIATFSRALHQTAYLNGIDPDRHSWRHGSIRERVGFLAAIASEPLAEQLFQTQIRRIRRIVAVLLLAGLAASSLLFPSPPGH